MNMLCKLIAYELNYVHTIQLRHYSNITYWYVNLGHLDTCCFESLDIYILEKKSLHCINHIDETSIPCHFALCRVSSTGALVDRQSTAATRTLAVKSNREGGASVPDAGSRNALKWECQKKVLIFTTINFH